MRPNPRLYLLVFLVVLFGCSKRAASLSGEDGGAAPDLPIAHDRARLDAADGAVLGSHCPDSLNNPTQQTAYVLTHAVELPDLRICPGEQDWFVLDLAPGLEMQFEACSATSAVPITVSFFRDEYPDPSSHMGGGSSGSGTTCTGTALWSAPGRYFFTVASAEEKRYLARLVHHPTATSCKKDADEPNDTAATASPLMLGQTHSLVSCPTDLDWLRVKVSPGKPLTIKLAGWFNGYELELALFAPHDTTTPLVAYHYSTPSTAKAVVYLVQQTSELLLRARNTHGFERSYTLTLTQ